MLFLFRNQCVYMALVRLLLLNPFLTLEVALEQEVTLELKSNAANSIGHLNAGSIAKVSMPL